MLIMPFDKNAWYRFLVLALAGIIVSGCLTWFMYFLIQTGEQKLDEAQRSYILDFVRLKRQESSDRKERLPEQAPVNEAPPAPDIPNLSDAGSDIDAIPISSLDGAGSGDIDINAFSIGAGDGEFLPIVKIVPVYPLRSLNQGIEGKCSVIYTVTTTGSTENIRVIEERCPHKDFRRSSVKAASKFKYKPKIINGEAIEVKNVVNTFIFEIHKPSEKDK